ncbi:MAG TPA: nodulation protein NfeD [Acidisarcina sp.]
MRAAPQILQRLARPAKLLLLLPVALWIISTASAVPLAGLSGSLSAAPQVVVLHIDDTIQPVSAEYLARGLDHAAQIHADAVLIDLNTPGGLLDSTREMVSRILASPVPVIFFITPSGSRAGSAGFFLLESADIAAMTPGSNAGAAHPVVEGRQLDPIMRQKLENDAAAFLRSYVTQRKRNATAAEDAVRNSKSYTAAEAQQLGLIDLVAADDRALLDALDGRRIVRFNGSAATLHTRSASLLAVDPTLREKILGRLMDPNLAVLIFVIGALLIYLEFNTPGTVVPGALGTLLVVLALFALNLLPIHYASIMLLAAAALLLLLEAKFASHGVLASAGILCLVFGTLTLVDAPIAELRISLATALSLGLAFGLITLVLVRLAMKARNSKFRLGAEALIGEIAVAQQPLHPASRRRDSLHAHSPQGAFPQNEAPQGETPQSETQDRAGQVLVHGELWQAESATPVRAGESVRVVAVHNLMLTVEAVARQTTP